jgi:hypothetical protein
MAKQLPAKQQQIIQSHAAMIVLIAQATQNPNLRPQLKTVLDSTEKNGWIALGKAIRAIMAGERSTRSLLAPLDEEDRIIIMAVLQGIQNPNSLPNPNQKSDASDAAPAIAQIVYMAAQGDAQSKIMLGGMADQMRKAGGDMARLSSIMKRLIDGERDMKLLSRGMGEDGKTLVLSILEKLDELDKS